MADVGQQRFMIGERFPHYNMNNVDLPLPGCSLYERGLSTMAMHVM
jgi:hypothetical protein